MSATSTSRPSVIHVFVAVMAAAVATVCVPEPVVAAGSAAIGSSQSTPSAFLPADRATRLEAGNDGSGRHPGRDRRFAPR